ncbi:MAG: sialidase family protein [Balneolaceae bacterium]|nr:sialidase family protein [Balneolaceae bacterium]
MVKYTFSRSYNNGITWTKPKRSNLNSPASPATLKRIPNTDKLILVWNNNSGDVWSGYSRTPLNITISSDGGETWGQNIKLEQDLSSMFAYTSITFLQGEMLFTYYHSSTENPHYYNLVFKKVSQEMLFKKFKSSDL